jgi:hypothetical protein
VPEHLRCEDLQLRAELTGEFAVFELSRVDLERVSAARRALDHSGRPDEGVRLRVVVAQYRKDSGLHLGVRDDLADQDAPHNAHLSHRQDLNIGSQVVEGRRAEAKDAPEPLEVRVGTLQDSLIPD